MSVHQRPERSSSIVALLAFASLCGAISGCVERTVKITSKPAGARVFLNDEEVGLTPVKVSFLWYGDYDIILRKDGYETLKTHYRLNAPWYQYPPIDLVVETMIPGTIKDQQEIPPFELIPASQPSPKELGERAAELRDRAIFE